MSSENDVGNDLKDLVDDQTIKTAHEEEATNYHLVWLGKGIVTDFSTQEHTLEYIK